MVATVELEFRVRLGSREEFGKYQPKDVLRIGRNT